MSLSAGRIRSINRSLARTHASAYATRDRNAHRLSQNLTHSASAVPSGTIKIVAVPRPICA
jgi:hypothetical protein